MTAQFARGPQARATSQPANAPHAALLIDFDNVTMGIRSDLTKELKSLLNSDIIKGKVAVQRAYADWRRYPQYIVPLAENSVDLIFAPAYGSSKKNATDIRLAIDALELVFTRPEIGTFILLSGDSDFSSLVLKLKEYGKYVIGVGIRESSSDLLVQNCDEYYSYSGLTGLTRAGEETPRETFDPWELVEIGVRQMADQRDVMRSDRLKQILLELDPNFDEKSLGFPKFNRFLQEAAVRGQLQLRKMENGQFEVAPVEPDSLPAPAPAPRPEPRRGRGRRGAPVEATRVAELAPVLLPLLPPSAEPAPAPQVAPPTVDETPAASTGELREAYELLQRATGDLTRSKGGPVRDSDVKRRMLELFPGFDEGSFGFSKFSRFLRQAHDAEVINLNKVENGSYEISLANQGSPRGPEAGRGPDTSGRGSITPESSDVSAHALDSIGGDNGDRSRRGRGRDRHGRRDRGGEERGRDRGRDRDRDRPAPADEAQPAPRAQVPPVAEPVKPPPSTGAKPSAALGFRRGSRRGGPAPAAPPPILAGQSVVRAATTEPLQAETQQPVMRAENAERVSRKPVRDGQTTGDAPPAGNVSLDQLQLPRVEAEIVDRLASYKGVGRKSAEAMVQAFGPDLVFRVLHEQPERVRQMLGGRRAEQLLRGWQHDHALLSDAGADSKRSRPRKRKSTTDEQADAFAEGGVGAGARKRGRSAIRRPKEPNATAPSDGQE